MLCRTECTSPGQKSFKQSILDVCTKRDDEIAHQVKVCVEGAVSDLHAADAWYHVNCMTSFMSPKSVSAAINNSQEEEKADPAFDSVIDEMSKDRSRLWNSVELFHQNQQFGGKVLVRRSLVQKINDHFKEDLAVRSSPGLASLIVFRKNASTVLNLASDKEEDQQDILIEKLAKIICNEVKQVATDRSRYDINHEGKHLDVR